MKKNIILVLFYVTVISSLVFFYISSRETYTVSFDNGLDGVLPTNTVVKGGKIEKPEDPIKEGYTFIGWEVDGKPYDFNTTVNSDIKLDAIWKKNEDTPDNSENNNENTSNGIKNLIFKNNNSELVKINNVDSVVVGISEVIKIDVNKDSVNSTQKIVWLSANSNIVTVDQNGNIKGVSTGTTYVTATVGNYSKKILVNVKYDLSKVTNAVGIYYTTWFNSIHMQGNQNGYFNIATGNIGAIGTNQYWSKPSKGYYKSTDKNVIKQHMRELNALGIDFIIIDNTNVRKYGCYKTESARCKNAIWWDEYVTKPEEALIEAIHEMRLNGEKTPYVINWVYELGLNLGGATPDDAGVLVEIYDNLYTDSSHDDIWVYDNNKPLILGMNNENSHTKIVYDFNYNYKYQGENIYSGSEQLKRSELKGKNMSELISYRRMTSSKYLGVTSIKPTDWSYLESNNNVSTTYKKQEQISIVPAINNLQMSNEVTAIGRRNGCTFYEQWQTAFNVRPKVVVISEWNEWIVGRSSYNYEFERYVDNYNAEFSRDIEPQDGGLKDRYYTWLKKYISNFKNNSGIPSIEQVSDVTNVSQCSVRIDDRKTPQSNTISIFGDGISAYEGTISASKSLYAYKNSTRLFAYPASSSDITSVNDMWWKILVNEMNYALISNESISNTRVTWDGKTTDNFYNNGEDYYMAGYTRINRIGNASKIIVFAGLSDIITESVPMVDKNTFTYGVVDNFADAYYTMLTRIKINYPNSKIICVIPYINGFGGVYATRYNTANTIIKKVVNQVLSDIDNQDNISDATPLRYSKYVMTDSSYYRFNKNISYVELNSINASNTTNYLISGVTPNKAGMRVIANDIKSGL